MAGSDPSASFPRDRPCADGRRARSRSSRSKIVAALVDLVGQGNVSPGAAQVAEVAGVGLRSVFRHFKDMDALYREMSAVIAARVLKLITRPAAGATWQARIQDLATRRVQVFETIMPYRISADLRRFESPFLMEDYRRMLRLESESVIAQLPDAIRADEAGTHGLIVILSFQTWLLLRRDYGMPVDRASAVVWRMLGDALAGLPEPV